MRLLGADIGCPEVAWIDLALSSEPMGPSDLVAATGDETLDCGQPTVDRYEFAVATFTGDAKAVPTRLLLGNTHVVPMDEESGVYGSRHVSASLTAAGFSQGGTLEYQMDGETYSCTIAPLDEAGLIAVHNGSRDLSRCADLSITLRSTLLVPAIEAPIE